jgi:hypothetical protein
MIVGAFVLPVVIVGMMEAFTTRKPSIPCTRSGCVDERLGTFGGSRPRQDLLQFRVVEIQGNVCCVIRDEPSGCRLDLFDCRIRQKLFDHFGWLGTNANDSFL